MRWVLPVSVSDLRGYGGKTRWVVGSECPPVTYSVDPPRQTCPTVGLHVLSRLRPIPVVLASGTGSLPLLGGRGRFHTGCPRSRPWDAPSYRERRTARPVGERQEEMKRELECLLYFREEVGCVRFSGMFTLVVKGSPGVLPTKTLQEEPGPDLIFGVGRVNVSESSP